MDERLIKAVAACLKTSSIEELREVINFYPELLTENNNILDLFKYFLLIAEEQSEKQVMSVKQHYLALQDEVIFSLGQQFKLLKNDYITTGNSKYLHEALHVLEKVLKHPRLQTMNPEFELDRLTDRSEIYLRLYLETGLLEYLNTGIDIISSVIEQPQDLSNLPDRLNNLALGLNSRYSHLGEIPDLEMVIDTLKQAINTAENFVSESNRLSVLYNNYGDALRQRYLLFKNLEDLKNAINALRYAINNTPDDTESDLIERLLNLGLALVDRSLVDRYSSSEKITDLEDAIQKLKQAVILAKKYKKVVILQNLYNGLGHGLLNFYSYSKNIEDLEKAIEQFQLAIAENSTDSPKFIQYFSNLGVAFRDYYSDSQNPKHLQQGIDAFRKAVKLGENYSVQEWFGAADQWFNWAFKRNSWAEIEEAYPALQKASKQLVEKQLLREHQEAFLQDTQGIAVKIAYARIQTGQLVGAVEALEQGVARLLSSALARSDADLTQLQQDSTELYERYQQQLQAVNNAQRFYQNAPENLREKVQSDWQIAEKQFNEVLAEIRQLQGHENFLLIATDINTVKKVSQQQALIYIFFTEKGGYALNVFQGEIQAIALPKLTTTTVSEKIISYFKAYYERGENWSNAIDAMTTWLYQTIMQPVLQDIPQHSQIILLPIGALNLLPLHAASDSTVDNKYCYVLDDYTISYAPNALSLQIARKRAELQPQKLLAINEPRPVKANALPICTVEIQEIQKYFAQSDVDIFAHENATLAAVKNALNNDYSVLHFSCHGSAEIDNPLKTGLLMANDETLSVRDFLNAQLNARLVSLSACETGMIGAKHFEEVVGLPTSLLQAGVACVVSSLWSVDAYSTMFLMMKFYEFFKNGKKKPAIALQEAQKWLRHATKNELLRVSKDFPSAVEERIQQKLACDPNGTPYYPNDKPYESSYYWAAFYVTGE